MRSFVFFSLIFWAATGFTQKNSEKALFDSFQIKPVVAFQLWSTYTIDQMVFDEATNVFTKVDNRFNFQLRRSRIGLKGNFTKRLAFNFVGAVDLVGRDLLAATEGGSNNGSNPSFRLWNAYVLWKGLHKKESFNITFGYMLPQIGRESITSAFRSTSMEKAWSQNYLRRHLVGIGPGRALGLNVGGIIRRKEKKIALRYDIGFFNPVFQSLSGNSTGLRSSLLLVGRGVIELGGPSAKTYSLGHKVNFFGKRKGVSIGIAGATQGSTDLFAQNKAVGMDLLLNWANFNMDADWTWLFRNSTNKTSSINAYQAISNTGYLRLSYNFNLKEHVWEPVAMLMQFRGAMDHLPQEQSKTLKQNSGIDIAFNLGMNYYINPNLKLSLHYTLRDGQSGELSPEEGVNLYFFQSGFGAIQRGDWIGLGLVSIL